VTTTTETTRLDQARDALRRKRDEIGECDDRLDGLRERREAQALAGGDTRPVRREISEAEIELEDLHTQEAALQRTLEQEERAQRHREQQAALAEVYRRDVEYLRTSKDVSEKNAELARGREKLIQLTRDDWYDPQAVGRGHSLLYEDRHTPELPVKLAPMRTEMSATPGKEPVENDIDVDIARLESLAQEAEAEAEAAASTEDGGSE
jgi:hypothetical protein